MSRLLGLPLREKVSGADMFEPLMARCALEGLPVFFLGDRVGLPGGSAQAPRRAPEYRSSRVGLVRHRPRAGQRPRRLCSAPGAGPRGEDDRRVPADIEATDAPRIRGRVPSRRRRRAGASLSFFVGEVTRAPAWMSRVGLEWFHRLCQDTRPPLATLSPRVGLGARHLRADGAGPGHWPETRQKRRPVPGSPRLTARAFIRHVAASLRG